MSSINITITHDPLAADLYATDTAPYAVSAWFTDPADGTIVTAERHGVNPERLLGLVLNDLNQAADDITNLRAPDEVAVGIDGRVGRRYGDVWEVDEVEPDEFVEPDLGSEEYVR